MTARDRAVWDPAWADTAVRDPAAPDRAIRETRPDHGAIWRLTLAAAAGTAASLGAIGLTATSAWLISRAALHPPVLTLMFAVVAVQVCGLGRSVFRYAERLTGHDAALRVLASIRVRAYTRLERLAPAGLAAFRSGDLVGRLVSDIDSIADRWLRVLLPYAAAAVAGAATTGFVALLLPSAGLVLAASLVAAAAVAPWAAGAVARKAERRIAPHRGELNAASLDLLRGCAELVAFGAVDEGLERVCDADRALRKAEGRSAAGRGIAASVTALAAGGSVWACVVLGVSAVRSGVLPGVTLAVVVLTPLAAHEVFGGLAPAAQQLPRIRASASRVRAVLRHPDPVHEPSLPLPAPAPPYDLRIENLSARWSAGVPDVLSGIGLTVPAGRRVAVVGPSGAGKTTLAMVLLRFLDPAGGRVILGGTDITELSGDTVRGIIGLCAQDAHVFDTTVGENVLLARRDASMAQVRDALLRAGLLDWVDSLPLGLDTPAGEHGARLSGGQRQRLALARVLLAGFPVLVLDEPTEHLDEQTADTLTRDLLAATDGRTVLLITHRTAGLELVDEIVRIEAGRLARPGRLRQAGAATQA
ncbi:MAG: thiol reductant ABC exporter subunit CydC [Streptosporangiaceae bacterium]|nr:thiol reductant ABC exporter subunit CydC [Streptosporangiaceae bacterium]MBV9855746.1 thiol reductant ABC exporter subunit CydC [Streptosporangiaceae bacterium]